MLEGSILIWPRSKTTPQDVLDYAEFMEGRAWAHCINIYTAREILWAAEDALDLARDVQQDVRVWNCSKMPAAYKWKFYYSQWTSLAHPGGQVELLIKRVQGQCNNRGFKGVRFEVVGFNPRDVLWRAGRQCERVQRWDAELRAAVRKLHNESQKTKRSA